MVAGRNKALGNFHEDTLRAKANYANSLEHLKEYDKAEGIHKEIIQIKSLLLGAQHIETLAAKENYANLLVERGRLK